MNFPCGPNTHTEVVSFPNQVLLFVVVVVVVVVVAVTLVIFLKIILDIELLNKYISG